MHLFQCIRAIIFYGTSLINIQYLQKDFYISRISVYSWFVYVDSSRLLQQLRREKGEAEKERSRNEEKALTDRKERNRGRKLKCKVFHFLHFLSSNFTRIFCKDDFSEACPSHPPYVSDLLAAAPHSHILCCGVPLPLPQAAIEYVIGLLPRGDKWKRSLSLFLVPIAVVLLSLIYTLAFFSLWPFGISRNNLHSQNCL